MICLLDETDRAEVLELLLCAPAYNLYMLGNLDTLGLATEHCQFWGDRDGNRRLRGLVNRYMAGWSVFGREDADWHGLAQAVDSHPLVAQRLQDNPGGIPSILPFLEHYTARSVHEEELMTLATADFNPTVGAPAGAVVRRAGEEDAAALVDFYADAGHMTRAAAAVRRPLRDTRIWLAMRDGAVVAAALTNAETAGLAMIGGVFTRPALRGLGLSRAVCSALCAELLAEAKMPVLYWDTPAAGIVYRRLGFRAEGRWRSVWLEACAEAG